LIILKNPETVIETFVMKNLNFRHMPENLHPCITIVAADNQRIISVGFFKVDSFI